MYRDHTRVTSARGLVPGLGSTSWVKAAPNDFSTEDLSRVVSAKYFRSITSRGVSVVLLSGFNLATAAGSFSPAIPSFTRAAFKAETRIVSLMMRTDTVARDTPSIHWTLPPA